MSTFNMYQWAGPSLIRAVRKEYGLPKKKAPSLAMAFRTRYTDSTYDDILADPIRPEIYLNWWGNHMVFPETPELVTMMENSNFEVNDASFSTPWPFFTINWWKELNLPGCLVGHYTIDDIREPFHDFMAKVFPDRCATRLPEVHPGKPLRLIFGPLEKPKGHMHLAIPSSAIGPWLTSWEAVCEWATQHRKEGHDANLKLEEYRYYYRLVRAVCGLCVWMSVHPELIRDGVPQTAPARDLRMTKPTPHIIGAPKPQYDKDGKLMPPHYRKKHFRQLAHPKFHRNPDGSIRIVEVKASTIHGGITHTVEERA